MVILEKKEWQPLLLDEKLFISLHRYKTNFYLFHVRLENGSCKNILTGIAFHKDNLIDVLSSKQIIDIQKNIEYFYDNNVFDKIKILAFIPISKNEFSCVDFSYFNNDKKLVREIIIQQIQQKNIIDFITEKIPNPNNAVIKKPSFLKNKFNLNFNFEVNRKLCYEACLKGNLIISIKKDYSFETVEACSSLLSNSIKIYNDLI